MATKKMKIMVLTAVGSLALFGAAFGPSSFAADTSTAVISPMPTVSPTPDQNSESGNNENSDENINNAQEEDVNSQVQSILGNGDNNNSNVQENDSQIDEVNNENNQEQASFNEDISAANQSGNNEDGAQLKEAATVVTSVTVPEVKAMTTDNAQAHTLITGVPTK